MTKVKTNKETKIINKYKDKPKKPSYVLDVKKQRSLVFKEAVSVTLMKKWDARAKGVKHCAVCGRPLVRYIPSKNDFVAVFGYYNCTLPGGLGSIGICHDIESCFRNRRKALKKEGKEGSSLG